MDKISPQVLNDLKVKYQKLFSNDPLVSFAAISLIRIIDGCWESGQMPTDLHDQLQDIVIELSSPEKLSREQLSNSIINAKVVLPNILS